jgi:hypothetical protein
MLPRLKALRVDGLHYDPQDKESGSKGLAMQPNSVLEHLVLLRVAVPVGLIGPFLKQLCSLRTFVWEDCLTQLNANRNEDGDRVDPLNGRTLSFNQRELLSHLAVSHSSTIEYLVLDTRKDAEEYIPEDDCVEHFKEFKKMT